jgi:Cu-Zn family superoxide dismutase
MKKIVLSLIVVSLVTLSCKDDKKKDSEENVDIEVVEEVKQDEIKRINMTLESKSGSTAGGTIEFIEDSGVVKMIATLSGLTPGTHAIHIHEKADCTAEDGTSAGGHWNPTFAPHGKWGDEAGFHKGDIGNVEADEQGNATLTMKTDEWCIGCGDEKKDILGKAIIVHQGTDDFTTQPTGAAGGRVSCGGIIE